MSESGETYLGQLDAEERIRELQQAAMDTLKASDAYKAVLETERREANSRAEAAEAQVLELQKERARDKVTHDLDLQGKMLEAAKSEIIKLSAQNAALKLLKDMDAITASAIGTFILGGEIPETLDRAKAVLVTRMLKAEADVRQMRPVYRAAMDWSGAEPSTSVLCMAIDGAEETK